MDVKTLCIGILSMGDASGYEIKKRLEDNFTHFYDASFGSIYPALNKLQKDGLVTCNYESQSNRPDKKVYRLTSEGRMTLLRELSQTPAPDRVRSEFLVSLLFSDLLPAGHISHIIDRRIKDTEAAIAKIGGNLREDASPSEKFVANFGLTLFDAALKFLHDNRHLVEGEALLAQIEKDRDGAADADN